MKLTSYLIFLLQNNAGFAGLYYSFHEKKKNQNLYKKYVSTMQTMHYANKEL